MKYLSLFSGIGGFELGLEQSEYEFENVGFSEIDKYAKSIYIRHFPRHKDLGDASKIDPSEIEDFDLLVGGFPCQAFSISGKRKGFDDTRGTLFFEIARICEAKRPRYLLLENVKGLLSHDGGRTYKTMLRILSELGYDVEWQVLNSKSFGVAQNRERVYIKGYFRAKCRGEILSQKRNSPTVGSELESFKLKPVKFNRQVQKRMHDADYDELSEYLRQHKKAAGATLKSISMDLGVKHSEVDHWFRTDKYFCPPPPEVWSDLKRILDIRDDKYDAFITEFELVDGVFEMDKRAYDVDGLSPTLTTKGEALAKINVVGNVSHNDHYGGTVIGDDGVTPAITCSNYKHPLKVLEEDAEVDRDYRIRKLTPRECERLQAFPDDWTKYGKNGEEISDTRRYTCLGNAVTTTVVTWIADNMFREYFENDEADDNAVKV